MADQAKQPDAPKPYVQPKVFNGEFVYWSFHRGNERMLAQVTSQSDKSVNVTLYADGQPGQRPVRGARHVTDPTLRTMVEVPGGVWEHTEMGKKIHELID